MFIGKMLSKQNVKQADCFTGKMLYRRMRTGRMSTRRLRTRRIVLGECVLGE